MTREPKERIQFNVRLDGQRPLLEAVKTYVDNHGLTMSEFVATALENALQTGIKPKANHLAIPNEQVAELSQEVSQHREHLADINQWLTSLDERLGKLRGRFVVLM